MDASRYIGVEGLGEGKKGVSNINKEFYDEEPENGGVFMFKGRDRRDYDSKSCSISLEQVKEAGELIGVSWVQAEAEKEMGEVARDTKDRMNTQVNNSEIKEFNDFINEARLLEVSMRGRKFTRIIDDGIKFSKLDRLLVNDSFNNLWRNLAVVALDRKLSDHCLIVLKDVDLDFGLRPFRIFDIWLKETDIGALENWSKDRFGKTKEKIDEYKKEAMKWDLGAEKRILNENKRSIWMEARKLWLEKENEYTNMLRQKDRIRWDMEGVENSKKITQGLDKGGLNAIVNEAVDKGIFRGVRIGVNRVMVSHLQYADDTIFFGEWSKENARSLMCILKCFEEVSKLWVNYNKSKLYGVGVTDMDINKMARWMKCGVGEFPFTYLGLPVGEI
ncbi:transposon TX1 [Tanacetum coccineum]